MAVRPDKKPRWATVPIVDPTTGKDNVIEPSEGKKDLGWGPYLDKITRGALNWVHNKAYEWIDYFDKNTQLLVIENDPTLDLNIIVQRGSYLTIQEFIDLIINGDFSNWTAMDPDNWIVIEESGMSVEESASDGSAGTGYCNFTGVNLPIGISQSVLTIGAIYTVTLTCSYHAGNGNLIVNSDVSDASTGMSILTIGDYSHTFEAVTTSLNIARLSGSGSTIDVVIDNVVVKLSGNLVDNSAFHYDGVWIKGTDWTITGGAAVAAAGTASALEQDISVVAGRSYVLTYTVLNFSAGTMTPKIGGVDGTVISADGTYTETILATGTGNLQFNKDLSFAGEIDGVSVVPLDQQSLITIPETTLGPVTAPSSDPRIDRVVLHKPTGVISITTGIEDVSPVPIELLDNEIALSQIALVVSQTEILNADITDERPLWNTVLSATTNNAGVSELSTDEEAIAKVDIERVLTPSNLDALIPSETVKGLSKIATQALVITGTDDLDYLTSLKLKNSQSFRGCLVYLDADQSIPNNIFTNIAFDQEDYDTNAIHDNITNNSRLIVSSGVTRVRVDGQGYLAFNATGHRTVDILKNGGVAYVGRPYDGRDPPSTTSASSAYVSTPIISVIAGDYFELRVLQSSGSALNCQGNANGNETWFAMEIIE